MSIIKDSTRLKEELLKRLRELYPSHIGHLFKSSLVIKDAQERGFKLTAERMSRYFSDKPSKNTLSDEQIIYLCIRYGIPVQLAIGIPVVDEEGKVEFVVPPFQEARSLQMLKEVFKK
jgi:hypothetical protein